MNRSGKLVALIAYLYATLSLSSFVHGEIVFNNETAPPANQQTANVVLGMDFSVVRQGLVTRVGAFDAQGDGFTHGVSVAIYNRTTGEKVQGTEANFLGSADAYEAQTRWKNIAPVRLPAGDYCVVAGNYGSGPTNEANFNAGYAPYNTVPSPLVFNSIQGAVALGNARWQWGNDLPPDFFTMLYPTLMSEWGIVTRGNGYPGPAFAAGTLDFVPDETTSRIVVPPDASGVEGGSYSGIMVHPVRVQEVYDNSLFTTGPVRIKALRFRRDHTVASMPDAEINTRMVLTTSAKEPFGLSSTFAENLGADATVVFNGLLKVSSTNAVPPGGPAPFDIEVPLITPFDYDPAKGNLLFEISTTSGKPGFWLDGISNPNMKASRCVAASPDATEALLHEGIVDPIELVVETAGNVLTAVLPLGMETKSGQWGAGAFETGWRTQCAYDSSIMPAGPIEITALRFRRAADSAIVVPGTVNIRVSACATPRAPDGLSARLADNLTNVVEVFSGNLTLGSTNSGTAGAPNPFEIEVPFTVPFLYDPAEGHFLYEIRTYSGIAGFLIDDVLDPDDKAQRVIAQGADAEASVFVNTSVDVVQIVYRYPDCTRAPAGLIAWWPGEGSGAEVVGLRPSSSLGELAYLPGKVGKAFSLNGTNSSLQVPFDTSLALSNYTVEAWVKPTAPVQDASGQDLIFGQAAGRAQLVARPGTNGVKIRFQFAEDAQSYATVTASDEIPLNEFTHVAGSWDGQKLRVFLNGMLKGEAQPNSVPMASTESFYIGGLATGGTSGQFFQGQIDEVSLYDRAVPESELLGIYLSGADGKCPPEPPAILAGPTDLSVREGQPATLIVTASGAAPLVYQWFKGESPMEGAVSNTLAFTAVAPADAGSYHVVITNVSGSITSSPAILTVRRLPQITREPEPVKAAAGDSAQFSVTAEGDAPLNYQWYFNNRTINGATAPTLLISTVLAQDAGLYHVRVRNNEGTVISSRAQLDVYSGQLTASFSAQGLQLSVAGLPGASYAIEWSSDLSHWNDLVTVLNAGATWKYTDTDTAGIGIKFYRLRKL